MPAFLNFTNPTCCWGVYCSFVCKTQFQLSKTSLSVLNYLKVFWEHVDYNNIPSHHSWDLIFYNPLYMQINFTNET